MGQTLVEKILSRASGQDCVAPSDLVNGRVDLALGNDITAPVAIQEFRKIGVKKVFDPEKVVLIPDHFTPNKDIKSAQQVRILKEFAQEQQLVHYYDIGRMGVEHALLPELGLTLPGTVIIGADFHTCTYGAFGALATGVGSTDLAAVMALGELWFKVPPTIKFVYEGELNPWVGGKDLILYTIGRIGVDGARYCAMEFTGPVIKGLSMEGRLTMCNMAVEAGGKCGLIAPDTLTEEYLKTKTSSPYTPVYADPDASYAKTHTYDVSNLQPQVAFPHLPENSKPVSEAVGIKIDQVVVGSCTNGRIEDLRLTAKILDGHKVHPEVRMIIIPATPSVYRQALKEGLLEIFVAAEAAVSTPTCGPCLGGHMGILAGGERCLATTNRNFVGRMGHPESEVYLANPAVAAATAVKGYITHPQEVIWLMIQGKVWTFGDDLDTDAIIPARYLNTIDPLELAAHCMEDADPQFPAKVKPGDIIVARKNFGCGSSREHAPLAIKSIGIACVIAENFARIFYRNALNIGLPILECPEAAVSLREGDEIRVDFEAGVISVVGGSQRFQAVPFPPFMRRLITQGGLINYVRMRIKEQSG